MPVVAKHHTKDKNAESCERTYNQDRVKTGQFRSTYEKQAYQHSLYGLHKDDPFGSIEAVAHRFLFALLCFQTVLQLTKEWMSKSSAAT
jgi:hypothetical protein